MMQVRRYREGEEECLRQLCRDTTCLINFDEYGSLLVEKWASRLENRADWKERVKFKNPFVAEIKGEIVGFAELTKKGNISAFYTHHLWQNKGVGSALLKVIVEEADNLGIKTIQVESSMAASKFFINRGFDKVEEKTALTDGLPSKSVLLQRTRTDNKRMQSGPACGQAADAGRLATKRD